MNINENFDVIVIGAGASGLIAAGKSASCGARTLLLEKMNRVGRKLLITGKGRCNITNMCQMADFVSHAGKNGKFLRPAFSQFFNQQLIDFFENLGVKTVVERGNRVFPVSEKSEDVVNALITWCKKNGVIIRQNSKVNEIIVNESTISAIEFSENEKRKIVKTKSVIVATGGMSYPATGSTGEGYEFAKKLGHTVISPKPSLVPVVTKGNVAQELQGLSLKNVNASVWINEKKVTEEFGEMLFTHFGLSGPIILTLSKLIVENLDAKNKVICKIDLKPALDDVKLDARLLRELNENGKTLFHNYLKSLLPAKMIPVFITLTGIDASKPANQISADERKKLRILLKNLEFEIVGHRSFKEAIVTSGGISLKEINTNTMESKIVKNLFFAGEVLDFDADTGGFNLQIAFSTGWLAGKCAGEKQVI